MKGDLTAAQVAELAELLEDAPRRVDVIDQVLQGAADGRGMILVLQQTPIARSGARRPSQGRIGC